MQSTIKVENVELKTSNFGPYKVIYAEGGERYNMNSAGELAIGGVYTIEWSTNKKGYKKIDRIVAEGATPTQAGTPQARQAAPRPTRDQSIEMQVCLKCAAELVSNLRSSGEYKPAEISKDAAAIAKDLYLSLFTIQDEPDF
jgi:hypothetical protein